MATLEILSIFCTGTCMIDDGNSEDEEDPFNRRLKDRRTPRIAIRRHCQSSFTYLFNSGNEQALLNCCGVDHKVFRDLLHLFQPVFDIIRITAFNCPGSWHDSTVADYGVYDQMQEMFDEYGAMLTVDAAFKVRLLNYLIQSLQADQVGAEALVLNCEATSVWQLSEWGMRMIQGQFPQLKDRLLLEDFGDRKVILNVMMLLYNYQTSTASHNQILNIFMHKKNGYFSYDTEPTEDATGMFE
eukprot:jgi/Psemu1/41637/gm1.41637_g